MRLPCQLKLRSLNEADHEEDVQEEDISPEVTYVKSGGDETASTSASHVNTQRDDDDDEHPNQVIIIARSDIPAGTRFGPYAGVTRREPFSDSSHFSWRVSCLLDFFDIL